MRRCSRSATITLAMSSSPPPSSRALTYRPLTSASAAVGMAGFLGGRDDQPEILDRNVDTAAWSEVAVEHLLSLALIERRTESGDAQELEQDLGVAFIRFDQGGRRMRGARPS